MVGVDGHVGLRKFKRYNNGLEAADYAEKSQ
ncbi:hypothetical protein BHMPCIPO_05750 [Ensifer sesbaniae]|nr:hypothetical protein [Ensifer sesbaniae]